MPEIRQRLEYYADQYERVHAALVAGPRVPGEEEIVLRYVAGEIGDRTARYVLRCGPWELIDACQKYDLPPLQVGPEGLSDSVLERLHELAGETTAKRITTIDIEHRRPALWRKLHEDDQ